MYTPIRYETHDIQWFYHMGSTGFVIPLICTKKSLWKYAERLSSTKESCQTVTRGCVNECHSAENRLWWSWLTLEDCQCRGLIHPDWTAWHVDVLSPLCQPMLFTQQSSLHMVTCRLTQWTGRSNTISTLWYQCGANIPFNPNSD